MATPHPRPGTWFCDTKAATDLWTQFFLGRCWSSSTAKWATQRLRSQSLPRWKSHNPTRNGLLIYCFPGFPGLIFWVFECLWVFPTNATIFLCRHWISHIRPKGPRVTEFRGFHLHQALLPMTFLPLSKAVPQTSHLWMVCSTHLG